jgi:hypothetical protein
MLIFTLSYYNKYITMPRLSLYKPEKAHDYKFLDGAILEQFMVGGTDIYIHKYLGPKDPIEGTASPAQPNNGNAIAELGIQDLLLLENRDRKYSDDVFVMRCIYNMQQLDWSLTQFGLFLAQDTIFIHVHLNDSVKRIGRKIMAGDVLELPHLKDPYALNDAQVALRRFYVVDDVLRPTEGFSQTWYPHLIKLKCKPLVDSQEFKDILDKSAEDPLSPYAPTDDQMALRDLMSSYNTNLDINQKIIEQAELEAPYSGYSTENLWMVPVDRNGKVMLNDASQTLVDASTLGLDTSVTLKTPRQNYYLGYMVGDNVPPNGFKLTGDATSPNGMGAQFPSNPEEGNFFLRTDFMPSRLFRYDIGKWSVFENNVRMTMTNNSTRMTQKTSFINNKNKTTIGNKEINERQSISKPLEIGKNLKPKADNP